MLSCHAHSCMYAGRCKHPIVEALLPSSSASCQNTDHHNLLIYHFQYPKSFVYYRRSQSILLIADVKYIAHNCFEYLTIYFGSSVAVNQIMLVNSYAFRCFLVVVQLSWALNVVERIVSYVFNVCHHRRAGIPPGITFSRSSINTTLGKL